MGRSARRATPLHRRRCPQDLISLTLNSLGSTKTMWELVATAVAGLNAGCGLQAALAGSPAGPSEAAAFARFCGRSRMLSLLLSTASCASCLVSYYGESRGALWLAAAAGVGISIPFNLLLMSPPTTVMESPTLSPGSVRFAQDAAAPALASQQPEGAGLAADEEAAAAAAAAGLGEDGMGGPAGSAFENGAGAGQFGRGGVLSSATAGGGLAPAVASRRRLMYSKSGVLVSPGDLAASWAKRFWFSAALSLTAFSCMMSLVGTGKDAATYGYAPY